MKQTILISVLMLNLVFPEPATASPVREPQIYLDPIVSIEPTIRPTIKPIDKNYIEPFQELKTVRPKITTIQQQSPVKRAESSPKGHGNFEWGWCTFWAQSQRPDRKFSGNARDWIVYANSNVPRIGAVAVNTNGAGGYGHVAIVIDIKDSQIKVQHMNWAGFGVVTEDWIDKNYWSGYIY